MLVNWEWCVYESNSPVINIVATFDPTNGIQITDLKKVNFFFGFNGSGKSTIAKYLHNLSLAESQRSLDFKDCTQNGYDESIHQILTFYESFTEVNFNSKPLLKGVFSLNKGITYINTKTTTNTIK